MQVLTARIYGYCDGVRRAMRIAASAAERHGGLQSEGPLVHNPQAVEELARLGVTVAPNLEGNLPVLVRAHGVAPERTAEWKKRGLEIVDATCPHVAANQRLAAEAARAGETVLFAGDPDHAETRAVTGFGHGPFAVVSDVDELEAALVRGPVFLLAQTTFDEGLFGKMAEAAKKRWPECRVADSICRATRDRQRAARELAAGVGAVVVVGGRESANTRRLAQAVTDAGAKAFLLETEADLPMDELRRFGNVGVTAGASTPDRVTRAVIERIRECPA